MRSPHGARVQSPQCPMHGLWSVSAEARTSAWRPFISRSRLSHRSLERQAGVVFGAGQAPGMALRNAGPLSGSAMLGPTAMRDAGAQPRLGCQRPRKPARRLPLPSARAERQNGASRRRLDCALPGGGTRGRPAAATLAAAAASEAAPGEGAVYIGLDFGTSGARVVAIDAETSVLFESKQAYTAQDGTVEAALDWRDALFALLEAVPVTLRTRTAGITLDATSSTTLLVSRSSGQPLCAPMMYNESRNDALPDIKAIAPPNHTVATGTSTLCKLVSWWTQHVGPTGHVLEGPLEKALAVEAVAMAHQADWLLAQLTGWQPSSPVMTDYNNALKVGYDPGSESYPDWLRAQPYAALLPQVVAPGDAVGRVSSTVAASLNLPEGCLVLAGTTDSIAAFLAAQVSRPGQAVTSLGSTLAVKLLSTTRVDDARYGIYSHRLGDTWLVGGASNTGGAVLRSFFSDEQLRSLSERIDPSTPSDLDYYPLLKTGERFPIADPSMEPQLTPRPADDAAFLHGILESMARIEARGYALLQELGASPLTLVSTAGGGAKNPVWTAIRQRVIGVPVAASSNTDAAFGAALLARDGVRKHEAALLAGAAVAL